MTDFEKRLENLADSDREALLAKIWAAFNGSDAHALLCYTLTNMHNPAASILLSPDSTDSKRAFSAGVCWAISSVLSHLQAVLDPSATKPSDVPPSAAPGEEFIQKEDVIY